MEEKVQTSQDINRIIEQRLKKLEELRKLGVNPYSNTFKPRHRISEIIKEYIEKSNEELEKEKPFLSVAGRIMALRSFGKSIFAHIQDEKGKIQIYFRKDILGNDLFKLVKKLDIGDIIGVEGEGFRTKTGELTILVKNFQLLTKSLRPLPEKYH
ncbi:MAG: lysine--tRNA ligase, partial [Deltaproteobacteria bacterium]